MPVLSLFELTFDKLAGRCGMGIGCAPLPIDAVSVLFATFAVVTRVEAGDAGGVCPLSDEMVDRRASGFRSIKADFLSVLLIRCEKDLMV